MDIKRWMEIRKKYTTEWNYEKQECLENQLLINYIQQSLDEINIKMTKPLWVYNVDDKTTHKFSDAQYWKAGDRNNSGKRIGYAGMILNKKFKYHHLDKIPHDKRDSLPL